MTIDRQYNKHLIFECDACDNTFESDTDDFDEAWALAKREGWRARKIASEWCHFCPSKRCQSA